MKSTLRAALAGLALVAATLLPAHNAEAARAHCGVRFIGGGQPPACHPTRSNPGDWWWGNGTTGPSTR